MGSSPLTRGKQFAVFRPRHPRRLIPAHAGKTSTSPPTGMCSRAHPRSRGENLIVDRPANPQAGSSPLTRGKPSRRRTGRPRGGLIPAHAGKTRQHHAPRRAHRAHPRSRGENVATEAATSTSTGSSPLTRGKPFLDLVPAEAAGLIPAHAGKTRPRRTHPRPRGAHPRSRGENWNVWCASPPPHGSSPLTRGKPVEASVERCSGRLIPAHAGKTAGQRGRYRRRAAHPRSRGENRVRADGHGRRRGSSPLTRGKLQMTYNLDLTEGLIPAHAGKTIRDRGRLGLRRAHPRSRGENSHVIRMSPSAFGSSPLTRGKRGGGRRSRRGGRLIPAHAGKTAPGIVFRWSGWAHPRSRGENTTRVIATFSGCGSSPLTRGKPFR